MRRRAETVTLDVLKPLRPGLDGSRAMSPDEWAAEADLQVETVTVPADSSFALRSGPVTQDLAAALRLRFPEFN